ncbi:hypothetical protein CHELA41_24425 [Hyphomicrobiales bacterium]|nr:hypothetical protein CHELA41_24425 [Hyphomicrobiales bacterium]
MIARVAPNARSTDALRTEVTECRGLSHSRSKRRSASPVCAESHTVNGTRTWGASG